MYAHMFFCANLNYPRCNTSKYLTDLVLLLRKNCLLVASDMLSHLVFFFLSVFPSGP